MKELFSIESDIWIYLAAVAAGVIIGILIGYWLGLI